MLNIGKDDSEEISTFYFTKTGNIFPLDINLDENKTHQINRKLRPEFIKRYEIGLNPDTFKVTGNSRKNYQTETEIIVANRKLKSTMMAELVEKLDRMEYLPLDSYGFTKIFHEFGVNIRYLGDVYKTTRLPHIQEICAVEMVARSSKKLLFNELTEVTFMASQQIDTNNLNPQQFDRQKRKTMSNMFIEELKKIALKFLNILFGNSEESIIFWKEDLKRQIKYDFNFILSKKIDIEYMPHGALLDSFCYHTGVELRNQNYSYIGKSATPFIASDFLKFTLKANSYSMDSHPLKKVVETQYHKARGDGSFEKASKLLRLKLTIEETLLDKYEYLETLAELADLHLDAKKYQESLEMSNKAIELTSPFSPM